MSDRNKALDKAAAVRLAVFDVDGVMTDGRLIFSCSHDEQKIFHVHDGLGLKMLQSSGCEIAIISSRTSAAVAKRMAELGIDRVFEGAADKKNVLLSIMNELQLQRSNIAYTGDDLVDLPAMRLSGLAIAVANAHPLVKKYADWTTDNNGGFGAVREICEMILIAQGKLDESYNNYLS